ncbi:YlxR family protein [cf. Phormidesmis sp. LEGE 11477]|uniref:YlxR family protein n=1 Tax=cf. Phormidesmis sp. LEGE 11477 TaxID=1828680 RepID=UPI00187E16D2|nr:YlxR family protein [cf. Phormidesmis sp. LEGE 11477]MBE9061024.1 YlxR family protein [cf. Phormidesmis sp. LEGE 11477]
MAEKNHRLCVSCRQTAHRNHLWRVVRTYPHRKIQLDYGIGRSAYLCPNANCLGAAKKKNRLAKALRTAVPSEIYQTLENRLQSQSSGKLG